MNTVSQTDWMALASARFPKSAARGRISGSGRFALGVREPEPHVILFETEGRRRRQIDRTDCSFDLFDLRMEQE
jgi:hypothetical protein